MNEAGRVWFLGNGNHLCRGVCGSASDEYGRRTWWLHLGAGVLVVSSKNVIYHAPDNEPLPDRPPRPWRRMAAPRRRHAERRESGDDTAH